jgi:hypothetical protein
MSLPVFRITERLRDPRSVAHVAHVDSDFRLEPAGETSLDSVRHGENVSLYALDLAHRGVAFVETEPGARILSAPFLHQAQRNHAQRVIRVPFDAFHALADDTPPPSAPPIVVHSTGRCGSTLLTAMLGSIPGVASVAEPDVLTSVERAVAADLMPHDDAVRIVRSTCRLATHGLAPATSRPVIKPRSEVVWMARVLDEAIPDAPTLFMYRDARRVIESYLRVLGRSIKWTDRLAHVRGLDGVMQRRHARRVARRGPRMQRFAYVLNGCDPLDVEKRGRWGKFLIQWLAKVHHYVDLREDRPDAAALRYEDLVAEPEAVMAAVLAHCRLPQESLAQALLPLTGDSQAGTQFHREARDAWHLSELDEHEMARTFRECTSLTGPDAILPGTLGRG